MNSVQRDDMYQEGILLGDFVVTEFQNSTIVSRILGDNHDLIDEMMKMLRAELSEYRKKCRETLELCDFVDKEPLKVPEEPVLISPTGVSKACLESLMAQPLDSHQFGGNKIKMEPIPTPTSKPQQKRSSSSSQQTVSQSKRMAESALLKSGLFSGLAISDEEESQEILQLKPEKIFESSFPLDIHGILDHDHPETLRVHKPMRKRKKSLTHGVFTREGSYNAVVYGGYVHLCGGALEWPFKTAEVSFNDFFHPN